VLPDAGYALGGAPNYTIVAGGPVFQNTVTVRLTQHPLPTAQITIFVHVDHNPINNTWDEYDGGLSGEAIPNPPPINGGLGGASITLSDMGGKLLTDAFGNPLGTTYTPAGDVITLGTGVITSMTVNDVNDPVKNPYNLKVGEAMIKFIAPGKYGITVVPPQFDDSGTPTQLDPDLDHRGHDHHRRLGQGERTESFHRRLRPGRQPRGIRLRQGQPRVRVENLGAGGEGAAVESPAIGF